MFLPCFFGEPKGSRAHSFTSGPAFTARWPITMKIQSYNRGDLATPPRYAYRGDDCSLEIDKEKLTKNSLIDYVVPPSREDGYSTRFK